MVLRMSVVCQPSAENSDACLCVCTGLFAGLGWRRLRNFAPAISPINRQAEAEASTGHSSFDLRKHRGLRRPVRSSRTGISWRILLPRSGLWEKSLSSRQCRTARDCENGDFIDFGPASRTHREGAKSSLVSKPRGLPVPRILCRRSRGGFGQRRRAWERQMVLQPSRSAVYCWRAGRLVVPKALEAHEIQLELLWGGD